MKKTKNIIGINHRSRKEEKNIYIVILTIAVIDNSFSDQ